jgi:hypothetical protein
MKAIVSRYLTRDNTTKKLEFPRDIYHIIHSIWIPHRGCNKEIKNILKRCCMKSTSFEIPHRQCNKEIQNTQEMPHHQIIHYFKYNTLQV